MPLYEFECSDCSKQFELLVRSPRWQGTPCPHCGSTKLRKQLSVFASSVAGSASATKAAASSGPACAMKPKGGCGCRGPVHRH